jgi:hypothetical protein
LPYHILKTIKVKLPFIIQLFFTKEQSNAKLEDIQYSLCNLYFNNIYVFSLNEEHGEEFKRFNTLKGGGYNTSKLTYYEIKFTVFFSKLFLDSLIKH